MIRAPQPAATITRGGILRLACLAAALLLCAIVLFAADSPRTSTRIGDERAVPRHLQDDEEFTLSVQELLAYGKKLFMANWTEEEGAGRPLTKGTGTALADPSHPLTGMRAFNRVSGPDANSCYGCHNQPYGIPGGSGDFVASVFVLGQRFDFLTFDRDDSLPTKGTLDENRQPVTLQSAANLRITTGMFGSGYLEMLARQMTAELQSIRDSL